jgi:hypothetical protein
MQFTGINPFYPTYKDPDDIKMPLDLMAEIQNVFGELAEEMNMQNK